MTLVVVLLILLVVTVLGIGGAQVALLGERSTRYDRDYLVASQAAEAALVDAELDIAGSGTRTAAFVPGAGIFIDGCGTADATRGLCMRSDDSAKPIWAIVDFLDTSATAPTVAFGTYTGRAFDASTSGPSGIRPERSPRYIIESIEADMAERGGDASANAKSSLYRITAIGFGPRVEVHVVMQTVFRKPKP